MFYISLLSIYYIITLNVNDCNSYLYDNETDSVVNLPVTPNSCAMYSDEN